MGGYALMVVVIFVWSCRHILTLTVSIFVLLFLINFSFFFVVVVGGGGGGFFFSSTRFLCWSL